jgi:NAD-dependent DNA ligase
MEQQNELKDSLIKLIKKEKRKYTRKAKPEKDKKMSSPVEKQKTKKKLRIKPGEKIVILKPESPIKETVTESPRLNEILIDLLERLSKLMTKKGDPIRSRAYTKAQETVMTITTNITNVNELKGRPNIGETILEKFKEYLETGTLRIFEREKDNPEHILSDIYGIGPKKAKELVEKGIKTIAQLRERQEELLTDAQKAGLKYYEDILERIPRTEIDEYNTFFKRAFDEVKTAGSDYEIVGSYRRGAKTSGDIDVIITSPNPETFVKFVEKLKASTPETGEKIILVVLSFGKTKCLVITKLPGHKHARRVDFMYTTPEEYPFAVLYFTGSKAFNTMMRAHALKMGTSLNEHGLYKKQTGKTKEEKVDHIFKNERDIFEYLNISYKNPEERIDGRSIISTDATLVIPEQTGKLVKEKPVAKTRKERNPKEPKKTRKHKESQVQPQLMNEEQPNENITMVIQEGIPIIPVIPQQSATKKRTHEITQVSVSEPDIKPTKLSPQTETNTIQSIDLFKKDGIDVLEKLTEKQLEDMLLAANDAYYNSNTTLMSDNEYDIVKEFIQKKFPKNAAVEQIGAPIQGKNKVTLPYNMPSMDKIKPDSNALANWKEKYTGPYVLSCKLDGVSGMFDTEQEIPKLYTRGDGKIGQDISHLIPTLGLNKRINPNKKVVVRGEFIIPRRVFEEKYKSTFANPRNLVSGIINSKSIDYKAHDLHFVVYEIIHPQMNPSAQMALLKELGYEVVQNQQIPSDALTNEGLSETLIDWRTNYEYEIDGVIVSDDNIHARKEGNPDHAFAFKMVLSDQIAEGKVVDVIWNPSKSGYLKPRVRIEPIKLGGVTIEYATGFNGSFIESNKIGIGAIIQIIRSGDVIPHIKSVTTPAEKAKMPSVPYHWTDTHIDIVLDDVNEDITVREKNITAFFTGIEVDGLSIGNVKRIMAAGFDTIPKILKMTKQDFARVEGFKSKMVDKIYNGIQEKTKAATLLTIMAASNMFGRGIGERKIKPILEAYPDILTRTEIPTRKIDMLKSIKGIGKENANSFVENIPKFMTFIEECGLEYKLTKPAVVDVFETSRIQPIDTSHPLYQKHIVMTKVRDQEIIDKLKNVGGVLDNTMSKTTFVLITKSKDDVSNKTKYANEHGIPIMTP